MPQEVGFILKTERFSDYAEEERNFLPQLLESL